MNKSVYGMLASISAAPKIQALSPPDLYADTAPTNPEMVARLA